MYKVTYNMSAWCLILANLFNVYLFENKLYTFSFCLTNEVWDCKLSFERYYHCNLRFKTDERTGGYHLPLSLWKIYLILPTGSFPKVWKIPPGPIQSPTHQRQYINRSRLTRWVDFWLADDGQCICMESLRSHISYCRYCSSLFYPTSGCAQRLPRTAPDTPSWEASQ